MEDQNRFKPLDKIFSKALSIIFRGIIWGIISAVIAGILVGFTYQLFDTFYNGPHNFSSDLNILDLIVSIVRSTVEGVITFCIPVGFIIGLSTGTLAAIFGHHCPKLQWWLALSWIGVATGSWFASFQYVGSTDALPLGALLLITFISSAASWMAYTSTIRKIKNSASGEISGPFTIFASLSNLFLTFIMICQFVYLLEGVNTP